MLDTKYTNIGHPADRVMEECSELIQAICKARRFGWTSCHPDRATTNMQDVRSELLDVREALSNLETLLIKMESACADL
jgi:NTP pyrophosphatase (non-canonical NTP hydrolase)